MWHQADAQSRIQARHTHEGRSHSHQCPTLGKDGYDLDETPHSRTQRASEKSQRHCLRWATSGMIQRGEAAVSWVVTGLRPSAFGLGGFRGGCEFGDQGPYPSFDLVSDGSDGGEVLAGRVVQVPVQVSLAGEDGAGVAASHGHARV